MKKSVKFYIRLKKHSVGGGYFVYRITIPKDIVAELGLKEGDWIEVIIKKME